MTVTGDRKTSIKGRWLALLGISALFLQSFMPIFGSVNVSAAASDVVINEIKPSSEGGTERWIELYNSSSETIDMTDWRIIRGSSTFVKNIPDGAKILPHGYYAVESTSAFLPQLSKGVAVELWTNTISSGQRLDLVDYGSSVPVGKSYGRTTDGASSFKVFDKPSKNTTNQLSAPQALRPTDDIYVNSRSVTQSWQPVAGASGYIYESYDDAAMTKLRWQETLVEPSKLTADLSEGSFWWRVKAVRQNGEDSSWSNLQKVTVDMTAPKIIDMTPGDGQKVKGTIHVSASVSDEHPNMTIDLTLNVNGREIPTSLAADAAQSLADQPPNEAYVGFDIDTTQESFGDGQYSVVVKATDKVGNMAEKTHTFEVDNTAPQLTVRDIVVGDDQTVQVSGLATDNDVIKDKQVAVSIGKLEESACVLITTQTATIDDNGAWQATFNASTLATGEYCVIASAEDEVGNAASSAISAFTIANNQQPPQGSIPEDNPQAPVPSAPVDAPEQIKPIAIITGNAIIAPRVNSGEQSNASTSESNNPESQPDDESTTNRQVLGAELTQPEGLGLAKAQEVMGKNVQPEGLAWYWWVLLIGGGLVVIATIARITRYLRRAGNQTI